MKINKRWWLYRWIAWVVDSEPHGVFIRRSHKRDHEEYMPTTLCTFFWVALFSLTLIPLFMVFYTLGASIAIALYHVGRPPVMAIRNIRRAIRGEERIYQPSVTWQFIRAKKRKVCPIITYYEPGESK